MRHEINSHLNAPPLATLYVYRYSSILAWRIQVQRGSAAPNGFFDYVNTIPMLQAPKSRVQGKIENLHDSSHTCNSQQPTHPSTTGSIPLFT